jgi:hypothetical protein
MDNKRSNRNVWLCKLIIITLIFDSLKEYSIEYCISVRCNIIVLVLYSTKGRLDGNRGHQKYFGKIGLAK